MAPAPSAAQYGGAGQTGTQRTRGSRAQSFALLLLRLFVGVHMFFFGVERVSWLLDAAPLTRQLAIWLADASPIGRWYLERMMPGAPFFARAIPIGSMVAGLALMMGVWTRIAAALALALVLSLQAGAGTIFKYAYLADPGGLPLLGALMALVIGGEKRPMRKSPRK